MGDKTSVFYRKKSNRNNNNNSNNNNIIKHFKSSRYRKAKPVIPLKERARTPESPPIIQGFLLT